MSVLIGEIGPAWAWIIAGLILGACELLVPGAFLIWIGLAAVLTGLVAMVVALPWEAHLLMFAALAVASVILGRRLMRAPLSGLNTRGHSLVGRSFVLDEPIAAGAGRLRLGDTSWRITGPDLPAGASVRVIRLDGTTLVVEAG